MPERKHATVEMDEMALTVAMAIPANAGWSGRSVQKVIPAPQVREESAARLALLDPRVIRVSAANRANPGHRAFVVMQARLAATETMAAMGKTPTAPERGASPSSETKPAKSPSSTQSPSAEE